MVVRRSVAQAFSRLNNSLPGGVPLGRSGDRPLSGEDTLFSRIAFQLGYGVAYFPTLELRHIIDSKRLSLNYFFRLMEGQGRSHAILEFVAGRLTMNLQQPTSIVRQASRFISRIRDKGVSEAIALWAWDRGYYDELTRLDCGDTVRLRDEFHRLVKLSP